MAVAPSPASAVLTAGLEVVGARSGLPARSLLPVTEVRDSTAMTVPGTTPARF